MADRTPGLYLNRSDGRWIILCRDGSRQRFYRAVMEAHLGRELGPDEEVHHINGDPGDDRVENLQLLTRSEHQSIHSREPRLPEADFRETVALRRRGLTTEEIGRALGIHQTTAAYRLRRARALGIA